MREIDYLSLGAVLGGSFYIGNNNEKHSIYELVASMFGEEYEKIFNLNWEMNKSLIN